MNTSVKFNQPKHEADWKAAPENVPSWLQGWRQRSRTHYYQASAMGVDFVLEVSPESPREFYMTAHKSGVRKSDCVRIKNGSTVQTYTVLEIDYYSAPEDMWMARLSQVN